MQFLRLSERWSLATDGLQWIVQRANRDRSKEGGLDWRGISFVASNKSTLKRVLLEKGAVIDSEGHAALRALPETFRARPTHQNQAIGPPGRRSTASQLDRGVVLLKHSAGRVAWR